MKMKSYSVLSRLRNSFYTKVFAVFFVIFLLFDIAYPTMTFALTGGPSQPEVGGFQPVDTSDMVDLFSGDFKYNIPLMDMDGYPLNLSYNGGVTMDQEASWVGLGWNLNPGVINRSMRGIPDDFNGDVITKEYNTKPSRNFGINAGATFELFGIDADIMFSGSINFGLGVSYSNYYGIGIEQTMGLNLKAQVGPLTGGLGITSSSENGLSIAPNLGLDLYKNETIDEKTNNSLTTTASLGIGSSYNTRAGVKQLSVNASIDTESGAKAITSTRKNNTGRTTYKETGSIGASGSFDLGMPTFTPTVSMPMHNISIAGNFQVGAAAFGTHPSGYVGGYYNGQKLASKTVTNQAYGYMNLDQGQANDHSLLDFNRENDGEFTTNTPALPLTNLTYDMFSVSGQGVGGSYRPFRSEIGYVFDPESYSTSEGFDIGVEFGAGNLIHGAGTFSVNVSGTNSGKWLSGNNAASILRYGKKGSNVDHEKYYFKEANEKSVESDPNFLNNFGGNEAVRVDLNTATNYNVTATGNFTKDSGGNIPIPNVNYRQKREKRNQVIYPLTIREINQGQGLEPFKSPSYAASSSVNPAHIGEITTYGTDGMRYVYGQPAYNLSQQEVTFAVGTDMYGDGGLGGNCHNGEIVYNPSANDNKSSNTRGLDNYFSKTTTPAYAHSYLLTAVLSPDYIDADAIQGPSIGDLGYYTKFSYKREYGAYKWRTPVTTNSANFNEGLKTDPSDDKASYVYGEKEIWYIDKIESKNYIAVFYLENRKDGLGVLGENGGLDNSQPTKLIRKISFFSRHDYFLSGGGINPNAIPLKEVHFEYDYSLCPGIDNFSSAVSGTNPSETGNGKLTLKKVYFTYQNSKKAKLSPYKFEYNTHNPSYDKKGYDRWGNYKQNNGNCDSNSETDNGEFPYVKQDQSTANLWSSAWSLSKIILPSGGTIRVEYESDDYAYVQHKRAMQMFKVVGVSDGAGTNNLYTTGSKIDINDNKYLLFELDPGANSTSDVSKYIDGVNEIYFKCLMLMVSGNYEYVSGYAQKEDFKIITIGATNYGAVKLQAVEWNDSGSGGTTSPIVRTAVQFGRLHLQRFVYTNPDISDSDNLGEALIGELFGSGLFSNLVANATEFVKGPNKFLYDDKGVGSRLVTGKSWVRLNNPDKKKLGGGSRVSRILMNDNWTDMSGIANQSFDYGQEYFYDTNGDGTGTSSGVASYEPQIGGEENPWKQPIAYSNEIKMAPDEKMYMEEPLGESFFPSPSVGYSKVTVQNLTRKDNSGNKIVTRHATGKVVHEFFTAKDFPTIVDRTDRELERDKQNPFSIASLLNVASRDYLTASQGFVIECNDMHGKPKTQNVYQEGEISPITSVEYKYRQAPYLSGSYRLKNDVTTISPTGDVVTSNVGVFFDMVADMRESKSKTETFKLNINAESFFIVPIPPPAVVLPIPIPSKAKDETQFRSVGTTKVIQRFGILEETIARDLGSVVSTKNLAYDSETGEVLVTQTTTDFNDAIYTLNYPAHWYYDKGMGQVYKNIGIELNLNFSPSGVASVINANTIFVPGDEIALSGSDRGWVTAVTTSTITVVKKTGLAVNGTYPNAKIVRSGRRNLASTNIASITTLSNPIINFKNNLFTNVLQASAVEFTDQWRTFCDCFDPTGAFAGSTTNPYILGTRGNWRMKKSLLHLSDRTQSHFNNNTNIRKDGMFTSYTPYYRLNAGNWMIDAKNWTFTSQVTEFSPFGQELENKDALGRYSAATFGYRQTFATSVAANSRYAEIGFDNFEDYGFSPCADNHFKFTNHSSNVTREDSHTGRTSIKVSSGAIVSMTKVLEICDPGGCNINLSGGGAASIYTINNGTAPYNIQYNIITGDPAVNFTTTGFTVTGGAADYKIEVIITDANGCQFTTVICPSGICLENE